MDKIDKPATLPDAHRRIEELHHFIDALRNRHADEVAAFKRALHDAHFETEVAQWAVRGIVGYQVRVSLSDTIMAKDAMRVIEELGKNAAHHFLRVAKERFADESEHVRALQHIHYLENHAGSRGVSFAPFGFRDDRGVYTPDRRYWPTRQPA